MENIAIRLIYFFMEGCGWCKHFLPQWELIKEIINNKDLVGIKTYEYERRELQDNEKALKIQKHIEVNGFPTIVVKINETYYKYEGDRTLCAILTFVKDKLKETEHVQKDHIDYLDKKINEFKQKYPNQKGGSIDYKKKYHKYKIMYNSILKKYNKIK
jgi:hypothetical protein